MIVDQQAFHSTMHHIHCTKQQHRPPCTKHHAQCTMHHALYHATAPCTVHHAQCTMQCTRQQQCNYCQEPPSPRPQSHTVSSHSDFSSPNLVCVSKDTWCAFNTWCASRLESNTWCASLYSGRFSMYHLDILVSLYLGCFSGFCTCLLIEF